jgi:hypothetical protein
MTIWVVGRPMGPQYRRCMSGWDLYLGVLAVGGPALVLVVRPGCVDRVGRGHTV